MKKFFATLPVLIIFIWLTLGAAPFCLPSDASSCIDEILSTSTLKHGEGEGVEYEIGHTTVEAFLTPN